jgi:hypothetical protein
MTTTDRQVRIIMKELSKHGNQGRAAAKAGVCRQTAAHYIEEGKLSSELKKAHKWQRREDPCAEVWPEIETRLREQPGVWVRFLFEDWLGAIRGDSRRGRCGDALPAYCAVAGTPWRGSGP